MRLGLALLVILSGGAARAVSIDLVTIGNARNPADTEVMGDGTTGYGSVAYEYQISKYEITNEQYAEFLNAVGRRDTVHLYNTYMDMDIRGGIVRSGSFGSYTYSVKGNRHDWPVLFVDFYDSARFANWLHNGQPTGGISSATTEDGAYTLDNQGPAGVTRNAGALFALPSEDEWYKAAFYDPTTGSYFDYPTGSDTAPTCSTPPGGTNAANCGNAVGGGSPSFNTDAGAYTGSASPYGTFDQAGNVWEWNEAIIGANRGVRGGSRVNPPAQLAASRRASRNPITGGGAHTGGSGQGFRVVALVPEPALWMLILASALQGLTMRQA